ncbi:MAG: hypothetical protein ACQEXQ_16355 [Bacillota bacterium]
MADIKPIETNIVSTLTLVTELKKVYDHEPKNLGTLPAATLFFDGFSQEDTASRRKKVTYRWIVRIYVTLRDEVKAQNDIKVLVNNSLDRLAANPQLGGTVKFHNVTNGEIFVAMDQNNPHMIAEMHLEVEVDRNY